MIEKKYEDYPFKERLNHLIFSAHKVQGLTCRQICSQTGISYSSFIYFKNGYYLPGAKTLIKLADYFGVSTDYLLGREGYELEDEK